MEQTFVSIGKNHDLQNLFSRPFIRKNQPRALAIFLSVASTHPDKIEKYASLASAYAVVFDQPFPRNWPHHQVPKKDVMVSLSSHPSVLPAWSRLTPRQARIRSESIVGDRTQVRDRPPSDDEQARVGERKRIFPSLGFRQDLLIDPIRSSSSQCIGFQLASWEIFPRVDPFQKGICVDQAYFSSMVGKAKGIPTLTFVGRAVAVGMLGLVFETRGDGKRIAVVTRIKTIGGQCDRSPIMETDNRRRVGRPCGGRKKLERLPGQGSGLFCWALVNRDSPFYRESLVRGPNFAAPDLRRGLEKRKRSGLKTREGPEGKEKFLGQVAEGFSNTVDLKIEGREKLAEVYDEMGNPREAEKIRTLIVRQNRSGRFDLAFPREPNS